MPRFFGAALVLGLAVGYLRGGRLRALADIPLRLVALIWVALAIQLVLGAVPATLRLPLVAVSYVLVAVWLVVSFRDGVPRLGTALLILGWLLNALVIAANGGMPVSAHALRQAGLPPIDVRSGHLFKHVPLDGGTSLKALGDVIPIHRVSVISVGDVLLLLGVALFVAGAMRLDVSLETSRRDGARRPAAAPAPGTDTRS